MAMTNVTHSEAAQAQEAYSRYSTFSTFPSTSHTASVRTHSTAGPRKDAGRPTDMLSSTRMPFYI